MTLNTAVTFPFSAELLFNRGMSEESESIRMRRYTENESDTSYSIGFHKDSILNDLYGAIKDTLEDDDIRVFLVALRDVAQAYGGISYLAKETDLNRESLYRTLSLHGNPTILNLFHMLDALGLELNVKAAAI